jgi:alpha-mannosidase
MQDEKIYRARITRFSDFIHGKRFYNSAALTAAYIYHEKNPIPYNEAVTATYKPITVGEEWGKLWGCAWFTFKGMVPDGFAGKEVGALINLSGEGCVWKDGSPWVGITNKIHWNLMAGKYFIPLFDAAEAGQTVDLLIEAGANGLFGSGENDYRLKQAELVCVDRQAWQLDMDVRTLLNLAEALPKNTPRRTKLIRGLNEVCNVYNDGKGIDQCLAITAQLLASPACASSLDAYSIGHAHLDLAWLWPIRETRRKGGRTFATALKYMEEYPEYKFGASQPQLYQWVKEDYPQLYQRVKEAVKAGRWELQGAMWVEPDMNLAGGEALVRQCFYGKKFYRDEFGKDVQHLWLPDVFGYSAALPQILRKCGVDVFMTQKISWNETNTFPHHTFMWQGIDGTEILTHFLPTNDYNLANMPAQLIESEKRYAQNDVSNEFLNLYGIGDGGGGPSRLHIEMGLRQQNLEGAPKFKFSFAEEFFRKIAEIPAEKLPRWVGELYLELHRGTYTTQGLMKKHNRLLELKLRDVEFLAAISGYYPQADLEQIWKDTLLNQFHDILPGSSITWVYEDAAALSKANLAKLDELQNQIVKQLHPCPNASSHYLAYNSQSWERTEVVTLPNGTAHQVTVPACGYAVVQDADPVHPCLLATPTLLENQLIRYEFDSQGRIISIFDKEEEREVLAGMANELLLWEDKPNNWGAWDVNHFYRETVPQAAVLLSAEVLCATPLQAQIKFAFTVGQSGIQQVVTLAWNSKRISFATDVDWKEEHKILRVSAQPAIHAQDASFEIQYGTLRRPTHENTSWDRAKFEVAAHRFADLSQPDYGFALLNDCKYGHYVKGNVLDLALLRSPKDTDPQADLHEHSFTYAYYPHRGSLIESDVLQQAHNLNSPLLLVPVAQVPAQLTKSYYSISGSNVKIEVIKPAEDGNGTILRLYETAGCSSENRLAVDAGWKSLHETDMLENNELQLCAAADSFDLLFEPFEIRTLRVVK